MIKPISFAWLLLILTCLPLAGCWDGSREIQDRGYVLAVAIDTADAGLKPGQSPDMTRVETFVQPHGEKRFRLSLQVLKLVPSDTGGAAKVVQKRTYVISNIGQAFAEMSRDMQGQISKQLDFEHLGSIIISEAAAKTAGLQDILEYFARFPQVRTRAHMFITPGEARPFLEYSPPTGETGSAFLEGIALNAKRSGRMFIRRTDLSYQYQSLLRQGDQLIMRAELADDILKIGGAGAFKRGKFVGYLDDYAVQGVKFIRGREKLAVVAFTPKQYPGSEAVFKLVRHDTKLTSHVEGNNIYFSLDIRMLGSLGELQCGCTSVDVSNPELLLDLERQIAEEVKNNILYGLRACQELGTDLVYFDTKLEAYEPKTWERIKDRWDQIFPTIPLEVSVNVHITNIGSIK